MTTGIKSDISKINIKNRISLGKGCDIAEDCEIHVTNLILGDGVKIGKGARIKCDTLIVGDFTIICDNFKMDCGDVLIGDYGIIYSDCLLYGKANISIGHNFFLGGNSILNAYAPLKIGHGVGLGTQSQVWTHALWGDEMEGCTLSTIEETTIEDGVWCIGHVIVGSGVTIGAYSTILPASALTKSTSKKSVWGGVPCKEISDKIKAYKDISLDEKWEHVIKEVKEYCLSNDIDYSEFSKHIMLKKNEEKLYIYKEVSSEIDFESLDSVWEVKNKRYNKVKSYLEIELMMYLKKYKARFYPLDSILKKV